MPPTGESRRGNNGNHDQLLPVSMPSSGSPDSSPCPSWELELDSVAVKAVFDP